MPKSSRLIRTPSASSSPQGGRGPATSAIRTRSVISRITRSAGTPCWPAARRAASANGAVVQVAHRDVDRDRHVAARRAPTGPTWASAMSRTRSVSRCIRPDCSASGMNSSGRTSPRVGCRQRTSASTPATVPSSDVHLGLVVQLELAARRPRGAARRAGRAGRGCCCRARRRRPRRRCGRPWRRTSRRRRAAAAARSRCRAPGTSAMPMLASRSIGLSVDEERLRSSAARTRSATSRAAAASRTSGSSTANSSPPSRATASSGPQRALQPLGDQLQHPVADRVPEGVVDLLEPVEVEQEQRDGRAVLAARRASTASVLLDQRACGWPARSGRRAWPPARAPADRRRCCGSRSAAAGSSGSSCQRIGHHDDDERRQPDQGQCTANWKTTSSRTRLEQRARVAQRERAPDQAVVDARSRRAPTSGDAPAASRPVGGSRRWAGRCSPPSGQHATSDASRLRVYWPRLNAVRHQRARAWTTPATTRRDRLHGSTALGRPEVAAGPAKHERRRHGDARAGPAGRA